MSSYVYAYNAGSNSKDYNDTTDGIDTIAIAIGSYTQAGIAPTDNTKVNSEGKYVGKDGTVLINQTKKPFQSARVYYSSFDGKYYVYKGMETDFAGRRAEVYISEDGKSKLSYDYQNYQYTVTPDLINHPNYRPIYDASNFKKYNYQDDDGNYYVVDDFKNRITASQGATAIGNYNKALGDFSSVLGGNNNKAVGKGSTVVGGSTPEFIGKSWITDVNGKYIDSEGQILSNQTTGKLKYLGDDRGIPITFYEKNTKMIYRAGVNRNNYYTYTDLNGVTYTATKILTYNCDFVDSKGNKLNIDNLNGIFYVDCNGNYFDENGNPYYKDDFDKRVISNTEGATNIVNNLAKGDFSTVIGGTGNLAQGEYSIVAGKNAAGIGTKSVAIGGNAQAFLDNSIALGEGAVAQNIHIIDSNAYAGLPSNTNNITVLSIGGGTGEDGKVVYRQIQGVAAGEISATSTDAINGSQLYAEVTKYTEKKNEITDKLNTEITERKEADTALGKRIDNIDSNINNLTKGVVKYDNDSNSKVTLTGAEGTVIANVKDGAISADSKEAINGSQFFAEQEARKASDITLQGNIDAEKTARENAVSNLANDVNTKVGVLTAKDAEIEGKVNDLNTSFTSKVGELTAKDAEIEGKVNAFDTNFTSKIGALTAKDAEIEGKVTAEKTTRESEVSRLDTRIDSINTSIGNIGNAVFYDSNEKATITLAGAEGTVIANVKGGTISADSKEAINGSQLFAEQEARKASDITLQGNIDAEKTARENAVSNLANDVNTKVGVLAAKDSEIEGKVDDLNTSFTTKVGELTAKDAEIEGKVNDLNTSFTSKVGELTAKDSEIEGKVNALDTNFTSRIGALTAKDAEIEGKVTAEKRTRESEVSRLDTRIDSINTSIANIGNAVFYDSNEKASITLAGAEGTVIANVKGGTISADSKEAINGSQLFAEQEARKASDITLQGNIDAEKTARENAVSNLESDVNTKVSALTAKDAEIEGKVNDLNTGFTTKVGELTAKDSEIEGKVNALNTSFTSKIGALNAKDTEIEGKVNAEKTTRESEVSRLDTRIDSINTSIGNIGNAVFYDSNEKATITLAGADGTVIANVKGGTVSAGSKEAINGSQLFAEQEARKASDITLQGNIDAEKTERENAVSNLANDVNTKVGALTAKDAEIEGKVNDLNTGFTTKVGELTAKDSEIEGKVNALDTRFTSKIGALTAKDAEIEGKVNAEKTARENAVSNLANDVNTQVGVLAAKDAEIEGKVNDLNIGFTTKVGELTAKDSELEGKVNALDTRIDSINTSIGNIGNAVFYDSNEKATITLAGAEGTVIANVKGGTISADSKEAINGSQLFAEQEARKASDITLQGNIDAEKTARENAVNNLANDINTKVGVLTAKDAEIEGKVNDLNTSFTSKVGELIAKDSEIEGKVNALDTNFTSKIGTLSAKDAEIEGKVTAEKAARENAVSNLANDVNTKVGELTAKDSEIEGKVNALDTSFTSKIGALTAKDAEIEGKVTAEKRTRESEVSRLDTRIDSINTSIGNIGNAVFYDSNEKATITLAGVEGTVIANVKGGTISADSKEAINGSQLFAEQEARKASDITLQGNIDAEKTARENAVSNLANDVNTKVGVLTAKDTEIEGKVNDLNTGFTTKVGELTAKDAEIEGKVNDLNTGFTTKVGELTAKDNEIEGKVNALDTRIDSINTSIGNIGNAVFYDCNEKASITLAGAEGTVIANVKGGTISADSKEAINGSQLFAEQEARKASDITLQGNIDAEKTARENAVSNLANDVNTKVGVLTAKDAEIEGKVNNLNTSFTSKVGELTAKDAEIEGKVNDLNTGFTTKVSELTAKDSEIEGKVNALDTRIESINTSIGNIGNAVFYDNNDKATITLTGAEGTVIANVKGGTISADSKEAINGSQLFAEQETRKASDITLQGNIDAEKTARENAVSNLANDVNTKVGALTAKDAEIEGKVNDLNTGFTTKVGELTAKDTEIEGKVNALDTRIDSINTSIGNIGNAVFYDSNEKATITLAGAEGTVIANVKGGTISADSKEAINGSQLFAEQEARKASDITLQGNIDAEKTARENALNDLSNVLNAKNSALESALNREITDRTNSISNLRTEFTGMLNKTYDNFVAYDSTAKDRVSFGGSNGTVLSNLSDGVVASGSTDAVTGNQLYQEAQARKNDISNLNSRIDNIIVSSSNGVNYDDSNKSSLTFKGTEGTTLKNVGAGSVTEGSMEAINGGQLYDEIQARKDADDALRKEFGDYVSGITENSIGYDQGSDKGKVTFKGENGTVLGNVGAGSVTEGSMEAVNGGQLFETNAKIDSLKNKIGSVKDGTFVKESNTVGDNINSLDKAVASNSTAIDDLGSRVSSGLSALGQSVNNVGAHAAALAALNPIADYDSKFSFAAGMGSYHSAKAGAIGLFYRPDDRYQFSIGGTTGNGEHLYNLGFSIALDKSVVGPFSNKKAMIREIVSLRDANKEQSKIIIEQTNEINELKKSNEEQDKKLAAQDAKIDKLMQLVESLASK